MWDRPDGRRVWVVGGGVVPLVELRPRIEGTQVIGLDGRGWRRRRWMRCVWYDVVRPWYAWMGEKEQPGPRWTVRSVKALGGGQLVIWYEMVVVVA